MKIMDSYTNLRGEIVRFIELNKLEIIYYNSNYLIKTIYGESDHKDYNKGVIGTLEKSYQGKYNIDHHYDNLHREHIRCRRLNIFPNRDNEPELENIIQFLKSIYILSVDFGRFGTIVEFKKSEPVSDPFIKEPKHKALLTSAQHFFVTLEMGSNATAVYYNYANQNKSELYRTSDIDKFYSKLAASYGFNDY